MNAVKIDLPVHVPFRPVATGPELIIHPRDSSHVGRTYVTVDLLGHGS